MKIKITQKGYEENGLEQQKVTGKNLAWNFPLIASSNKPKKIIKYFREESKFSLEIHRFLSALIKKGADFFTF